ncbi:diguanylate cyclase [Mesorhizobium sp. L-8-10]|uniref:putative bifunctional diguanylate cyclase/phosphodiesterase n=1 Tax=unclassified Mesorhizobium TaxID=325217 RepID=UPI001926B42F|nr:MULTISPECIES: EAL domain-containing protein [unclassified Mesorhizobium]BCH20480.1 diguanylate cyclase [Mesorhizobium sp. L-8-3]BCH28334.1 diguanylate cyclase [Mesorhizobium sp. L-8-10]
MRAKSPNPPTRIRTKVDRDCDRQEEALRQGGNELRAQNERFVAAVETMSHGLAMFDADERMIICNRYYLQIFRLDPDVIKPGVFFLDILRHSVDIGVASQSAEELYAYRQEFIGSCRPATYEEVLADGRVITITHRPTAEGGWVSVYEDVTEKRRVEQALIEQIRRFDAALGNMSQGLLMFDADARLIVRNDRFLDIYRFGPELVTIGQTYAEILGRLSALGIYPGLDAEREARIIGAAMEAGRTYSVQRELSDGRTIAVSHRPVASGGWVSTFEDVTERRQAETRILHMAHHDGLTDLSNRVVFRERLEQAAAAVQRDNYPFAVLSVDLDRFKSVNDTLGHPAGDALLKSVAERLRGCLRASTDAAARLGGDEFAILQPGISTPQDAGTLAARLIETIGRPHELDGRQVTVGVSIGIAVAPMDGDNPDQLLKNADLALYRAKREGRNTYRFFEAEMDATVRSRRELEIDLRGALLRGEFELHYQPIQDLGSGRINGCEALLRWCCPKRGLVSPADFIPVAEEANLIGPIGQWVLDHACTVAAGWPDRKRIAVNVSAVQFQNGLLSQNVLSAIASSGLSPDRLILEITETSLLGESELVAHTLMQLRSMGVRIALDDFGTGYSSLSYLKRFPFDTLKIDRSFVRDLDDVDTAAIVRAIVGLAGRLGISVTAEGVETAAQRSKLKRLGCNEAQGFLIGAPMPEAELFQDRRRRRSWLKALPK